MEAAEAEAEAEAEEREALTAAGAVQHCARAGERGFWRRAWR